jgi:hypothetical protein
MWSLFGNQSDSPYDLYIRQYRFKWFIWGLAVACALLALELMRSTQAQRWLTVLLLLCLVLLLYTVSVYVRDGLKLRLAPKDDLDHTERERDLYWGKWELRKAYIKRLFAWWFGPQPVHPRHFPMHHEEERYEARNERQRVRDVRRVPLRPQVILKNSPNDQVAADFLREMKLDGKTTIWVRAIKQWFFRDLVPLILDNHLQNLSLLNDLLEEFTAWKGETWVFGATASSLQTYEATNLRRSISVSLQDVQKLALDIGRSRNLPADAPAWRTTDRPPVFHEDRKILLIDTVRQRSMLEKYFTMPNFPATRDYVLARCQAFRYNHDVSLRQDERRLGTDTNHFPTDLHILAHIFFTMLNIGNNKAADPNFDLTKEFLCVYPNLPRAAGNDQVYFYQISSDWRQGPQFDIISGLDHWVAWSGDDNLYHAIALFLLHVRDRCRGRFFNFDCRELMHLIA